MDNKASFPHGPGTPFSGATVKADLPIRSIAEHCRAYKGADIRSALFQLTTTGLAFFALMAVMLYGFTHQIYVLPYALMLPASGLLVRLFIIQHDCGHASFFATKAANDMTGRMISVLTFTPYDGWRRAHNMHHASSGNLSNRGVGSIDTLTVREYNALSKRDRLSYALYRNPFMLLVLATPFYMIALQRLPTTPALSYFESYKNLTMAQTWRSITGLNIALAVVYGAMVAALGWQALVFVYLPVVVLTSWIGGWFFFIQHQFEDSYWSHKEDWDFQTAALHGSSYYALPKILQWFSGNIGLHHIHHLCPAIPNYKLQKCMDGHDALQGINRMTLRQSLQCLRWALWDEDRARMISLREWRAAKTA